MMPLRMPLLAFVALLGLGASSVRSQADAAQILACESTAAAERNDSNTEAAAFRQSISNIKLDISIIRSGRDEIRNKINQLVYERDHRFSAWQDRCREAAGNILGARCWDQIAAELKPVNLLLERYRSLETNLSYNPLYGGTPEDALLSVLSITEERLQAFEVLLANISREQQAIDTRLRDCRKNAGALDALLRPQNGGQSPQYSASRAKLVATQLVSVSAGTASARSASAQAN